MTNFDDEITLRDVFEKIGEHLNELKRNTRWLLLFMLLFVVIYSFKSLTTPTQYKAECTFMVNDQDGRPSLGISSILGQFGFGGGSEIKLEKIAELSKTRAMTSMVMFNQVDIGSEKTFLSNHYIAEKEKHGEWVKTKIWEETSNLEGYRFVTDSIEGFNRLDNSALLKLNKLFKEDLTVDIDEITGILKFSIFSTNEELGYELLNGLFDKVSEYYTGKSVEKQQSTYDALVHKCDSLEGALDNKEYALASIKDTYYGRWLNTEKVSEDKLFREIRMLTVMYGEALKNKEFAAFSLDNMTPFIQAIDRPIIPLKRIKEPFWMSLLKAIIFGLATGIIFVVSRKIYSDAMNDK